MSRGREANYAYCITQSPGLADVAAGSGRAPELDRAIGLDRERAGLPPEASRPPRTRDGDTGPVLDPVTVMAQVMARDGSELSATETLERELARADDLGVLGAIWDDLVRREQHARFGQALRAALGGDLAEQALDDPALTWLWRTLREAEAAGLDGCQGLHQAVAARTMTGARDVARVIDSRARRMLRGARPQPPGCWAGRVPGTGPQELRDFLRELAAAMDDRTRRLGEHAARTQPLWARQARPAPGRPDRSRTRAGQSRGTRHLARRARRGRPDRRHRPATLHRRRPVASPRNLRTRNRPGTTARHPRTATRPHRRPGRPRARRPRRTRSRVRPRPAGSDPAPRTGAPMADRRDQGRNRAAAAHPGAGNPAELGTSHRCNPPHRGGGGPGAEAPAPRPASRRSPPAPRRSRSPSRPEGRSLTGWPYSDLLPRPPTCRSPLSCCAPGGTRKQLNASLTSWSVSACPRRNPTWSPARRGPSRPAVSVRPCSSPRSRRSGLHKKYWSRSRPLTLVLAAPSLRERLDEKLEPQYRQTCDYGRPA